MISVRPGGQYELKAPGYVIRASSRSACFDTYFLCMINNVPCDTFNPTVVTVDEAGNCELRVMFADEAVQDGLGQLGELATQARQLTELARAGLDGGRE